MRRSAPRARWWRRRDGSPLIYSRSARPTSSSPTAACAWWAPPPPLARRARARICAPGSPLPPGMEPGLEATHYFQAPQPTFANGVHVAVVVVDRETGGIEIVDYVVVSDAGQLINPLIVEGQIQGGVAQGFSGALYEELAYDDIGQLRAVVAGVRDPHRPSGALDAHRPPRDAEPAECSRGQGRGREWYAAATGRPGRRRRGRAVALRRSCQRDTAPARGHPAARARSGRGPSLTLGRASS